MKRPSLFQGIFFAFAAAVLSVPLWWVLASLTGLFGDAYAAGYAVTHPLAPRAVLGLVTLAYLGYLLRVRGSRVGSLTLAAANSALAIGMVWAPLPLGMSAVLLGLLCCVNRTLLFHRSPALVWDAALSILALIFAGYLYRESGSLAAGVWGFLLLQSLWVLIPPSQGKTQGEPPTDLDSFVRSRRQAEAALERLSQGELS